MCNLGIGVFERGFEKGMAQGEERGIEKTALEMLKENLPLDMISRVTKLPIEKINALSQSLKQLNK